MRMMEEKTKKWFKSDTVRMLMGESNEMEETGEKCQIDLTKQLSNGDWRMELRRRFVWISVHTWRGALMSWTKSIAMQRAKWRKYRKSTTDDDRSGKYLVFQ